MIYLNWLSRVFARTTGWDGASNVYARLEADTSTYSFDPDHATMDDVYDAGFVEVTASGYAGPVLVTGKAVSADYINNRILLSCNDLNFGEITSGTVIKGILFLWRKGSTFDDDQDLPIFYQALTPAYSTSGGNVIFSFADSRIAAICNCVDCCGELSSGSESSS